MELYNFKNSISNYIQQINEFKLSNNNVDRFPKFQAEIKPIDFWKLFLAHYENISQKPFIITDTSKFFVYTIIYYFLRNERFYKSPLIYKIDQSKESLEKGLLIVGGIGAGKTTILKTIVSLLKLISVNHYKYPIRIHNTSIIVMEYENELSNHKNDVIEKYSKGFRIFDDLKNEREASNYGKIEIFQEILYNRCENKNFNTVLLCNYDSEYPNDMQQAIESFGRYGDRVYDRLFEAYNFIEFKGKSNR